MSLCLSLRAHLRFVSSRCVTPLLVRTHGTSKPPPVDVPGDVVDGSSGSEQATPDGHIDPEDMVEMWNYDAPAGPEWGGPRGGEPTKYGDWAKKGRVSDF